MRQFALVEGPTVVPRPIALGTHLERFPIASCATNSRSIDDGDQQRDRLVIDAGLR